MPVFLVSMPAFHSMPLCCLISIYPSLYRLQVTVIEVFPPPVPEGVPTPTSATPSNLSSPANGISPLTSCDPSPSVGGHVSVIVNATTPMINKVTTPSNKYVSMFVLRYCMSRIIGEHCIWRFAQKTLLAGF